MKRRTFGGLSGLILLSACASAGGGVFPGPVSSQYDRAVRVGIDETGPLAECALVPASFRSRTVTGTSPRLRLDLPELYATDTARLPTDVAQYFGATRGEVQLWRRGVGVPLGDTWTDVKVDGRSVGGSIVLMLPRHGYTPIALDQGWAFRSLRECGTWVGQRPARVFLFEVTDGGSEVLYGLSAYFRWQNGWVSMLGLSTQSTGHTEFIAILQSIR